MFRKPRKNILDEDSSKKLFRNSRRGVLALQGDEGYPYAIPINYLYDEENNKIYFHGLGRGHKVDGLNRSDKVCFTVYGNESIKEETWAPYVQSVVIFGRCHLLEKDENSMEILKRFAMKYYPSEELVMEEIDISGKDVQMFQIDIEHMTGKEVQER